MLWDHKAGLLDEHAKSFGENAKLNINGIGGEIDSPVGGQNKKKNSALFLKVDLPESIKGLDLSGYFGNA